MSFEQIRSVSLQTKHSTQKEPPVVCPRTSVEPANGSSQQMMWMFRISGPGYVDRVVTTDDSLSSRGHLSVLQTDLAIQSDLIMAIFWSANGWYFVHKTK